MPKWISITKAPFDYRHSPASVQAFTENGEFYVKDEVAEYAIKNGYAKAGKAPGSTAKSTKSGPARVRARGANKPKAVPASGRAISRTSGQGATKEQLKAMEELEQGNAGASDTASNASLAGASVSDADSASARNE